MATDLRQQEWCKSDIKRAISDRQNLQFPAPILHPDRATPEILTAGYSGWRSKVASIVLVK